MSKEEVSSSSSSVDTATVTIAYLESKGDSHEYTETFSTTETSSSTSDSQVTQGSTSDLFGTLDQHKEKEEFFGYEPVWRSMSMSDGPKLHALEYFWSHSIFQMFTFLMTHLLAHTPGDPVHYLRSLVDRCLQFRDHGGDPPLLFEESHISSVYTALDPMDDGSITYSQYLAGMSTLGVTDFNVLPDDMEKHNRNVPKKVFLAEAKHALLSQLKRLLGKSRVNESVDEHDSTGGVIDYDFEKEQNCLSSTRGSEVGDRSIAAARNEWINAKLALDSDLPIKVWRPSKISFRTTPFSAGETSVTADMSRTTYI